MSDLHRLRLARTEGVGPVTFRRLLRRYPDPEEALDALPALARAGGRLGAPHVPSVGTAEREMERIARLKGRLMFVDRPGYPALLGLLDDAPPVLVALGRAEALDRPAVALVGSRNASANGQRIAEQLAQQMTEAALVVVSGLARGIDAAAHEGAMRAGITVACVAGGVDVPYPPDHARLQARIAAEGVVVGELPLGTAPQARHFPRRNRVIAGLSLGVVVVEAATRSGSLITARLAQEAGREVFAVPGSPLDPRCRGTNDLIRKGAHLVESVDDVLANLPDHPSREGLARDPLFARGRPAPAVAETPSPWREAAPEAGETDHARMALLQLLGPAPTSVDDLARRCQFSLATINSALMDLELAGRVEALPGNRFALVGEPGP